MKEKCVGYFRVAEYNFLFFTKKFIALKDALKCIYIYLACFQFHELERLTVPVQLVDDWPTALFFQLHQPAILFLLLARFSVLARKNFFQKITFPVFLLFEKIYSRGVPNVFLFSTSRKPWAFSPRMKRSRENKLVYFYHL